MPRTQARLCTLDKVDQDWLRLTIDEQWLYTVLLRQHRLTLIGVIDLMPQRWCSASDMTSERAMAALGGLDRSAFVVVDAASAEVLVRTFVRHDIDTSRLSGATRAGIWNAWNAISSTTLRAFAVTEIPDGVWTKLEASAPAEAAEIRRSPPLKRELALPQEREPQYPHERPSSYLPPPTGVPTSIISPTGGSCRDEPTAATSPGVVIGDGFDLDARDAIASPDDDRPSVDPAPEPSPSGDTDTDTDTEPESTNVDQPDPASTTVDAEPLVGDVLEQAIRRTAVLIGRRQTTEAGGVDDPDAYAATCTRKLLDKADPEPRDRITDQLLAGSTPEEITSTWGADRDVFGLPSADHRAHNDPEAKARAERQARDREAATAKLLAESRATSPADPGTVRAALDAIRHRPAPAAAP